MNHKRYKTVEFLIHAWIQSMERDALGGSNGDFKKIEPENEVTQPFRPLTPLRSSVLYWDSQLVNAS